MRARFTAIGLDPKTSGFAKQSPPPSHVRVQSFLSLVIKPAGDPRRLAEAATKQEANRIVRAGTAVSTSPHHLIAYRFW